MVKILAFCSGFGSLDMVIFQFFNFLGEGDLAISEDMFESFVSLL